MFVTFVASHSQRHDLLSYYQRIFEYLNRCDYKLFTGKLFETDDEMLGNEQSRKDWYDKAIKSIKKSDVVVVEISYPSTANVGHELTYALESGVPVVALYKEGRDPLFLKGIENEKLIIMSYDDRNLESVLEESLDYATTQQDTRFNFFISPKIGNFLDWVSKKKRLPRAVYLRKLIEEDMKRNKEFEG